MFKLIIIIFIILLIFKFINNNYCIKQNINIKAYKILYIENNVDFHYEIIESVIFKYKQLYNLCINDNLISIYLKVNKNKSYISYIKNKYPYIKINTKPNRIDYFINCTIYEKDCKLIKNKKNYKYIAHESTDKLKFYNNVLYLSPLAGKNYFVADILPFSDQMKVTKIPRYIIQGGFDRRNFKLLENILNKNYDYNFEFIILGKGNIPDYLKKYKNKFTLKKNLNFIDYHKEFTKAYCILPLITKKSHPLYYINKLSSSINYILGYNCKTIIDKDLQNIYKLNNVEVFNDENDISNAFSKTLIDFYK